MSVKQNESGVAHLGLILLIVAVVGVGGIAYWRVSTNNKPVASNAVQTEGLQPLPTNLEGIKTQEEVKQIVGVGSGADVVALVLESKDNGYVYKVTLSNGKKLVIDAQTGKVLSEESTEVSDDNKIPASVQVTISSDQAYKIAASKHSSPVKTIEMEVEDKKVVYKIEYKDGSKIEIDASNGAVLKLEVKDESKDSNEDQKDNNETEDQGGNQ